MDIGKLDQPKRNLLILGYNALADGFLACSNYLKKDYHITFFPLLHYHNHQLEVRGPLIQKIKEQAIDVILLWHFTYFYHNQSRIDDLQAIKTHTSSRIQWIIYNWDPMPPKEVIDPLKVMLLSMVSGYLTCDSYEIQCFESYRFNHIAYCPSGFDPSITYPMPSIEHQCDVSIICTTLYNDYQRFPLDYVRLNRKHLMDLIYQHRHELNFHIYGPQELGTLYPECYRGFITYKECPKVFFNSKVNLCIHAVSYNSLNDQLYFSERLPQILGSRGLLYCETEYEYLLLPGLHYVLADPVDPISQIKNIIQSHSDEYYQTMIEAGYQVAIRSLTWDNLRLKLNHITQ